MIRDINDHVAGLVVDFAEHALLLRTPITVCAPVNSLLLGRSPHLAAWRLGGLSLSLSLVRDAEGFDGCDVARDHQKILGGSVAGAVFGGDEWGDSVLWVGGRELRVAGVGAGCASVGAIDCLCR